MTAQDDPTDAKRKGAATGRRRAAPKAEPSDAPVAKAAKPRHKPIAPSTPRPKAARPAAAAPDAPRPAAKTKPAAPAIRRTGRGFLHAAALSSEPVRTAFSRRGFAETRVLTDWDAVVGEALAPLCRPVKVTYGGGGFGATLIVLAEGARAPEVEMLGPRIIERVNAFYGYRAVSRFKVVQTTAAMGAASGAETGARTGGLAESSRGFDRSGAPERRIGVVSISEAQEVAAAVQPVSSDPLRAALDRLGRNIISRRRAAVGKDQPL
ncbi:MAG: hypothetical protein ACJA1L_001955 [Paracoccaceae bacterium]|jgi:hypothetical protein